MTPILLHPAYFPCIAQMVAVAQAKNVVFEVADNYQKQTYRNRAYIAHTGGKLLLNVPIRHSKGGERQSTKQVCIEDSFDWQVQHWKSLQSAYRTSPFFEFYEDDLEPLFSIKVERLMDHNLTVFNSVCELLELNIEIEFTTEYEKSPRQRDLRKLVEAKKEPDYVLEPYTQVFEAKHGFLSNLSVLDLIFNEGPNAADYLLRQELEF